MTEQWRGVPRFGDYIVSSLGRIRHRRVNAPILRGSRDKDGYHRVCLNGCTIRTHVIVAEAFHGPRPDGCECAHLDGDCVNNAADNLAWIPHAANNDQKRLHGTHQAGEKHPRARLTEAEVAEIRKSSGLRGPIAARFGISKNTVSDIRLGRRWRNSDSEGIARKEPS